MKRIKPLKGSALTVLFGMAVLCTILCTACPNAAGGGGGNTGGGTITPITPITPDTAILTVDPAHKTIKVKVTSSDGSRITVEGADKDGIDSDTETELTAKDTQIILKNSKITKLICLNNKLAAIDVRGLSDLQELKCYSNKLTSLDVQGLAQLQKLDCGNNQLTSRDVRGLSALKTLNCSYNKLTSLDVQGLVKLK